MAAPDDPEVLAPRSEAPLTEADEEPPVVARMVIEIRSDGSRTIARGALEDRLLGETATVEAEASTPLELAGKLLRSLVGLPLLGRVMKRGRAAAKEIAAGRGVRRLTGRDDADEDA